MAEKREHDPSGGSSGGSMPVDVDAGERGEGTDKGGERAARHRRSLVGDPDRTSGPEAPSAGTAPWQEPRGVQKHIADADKLARTGSRDEHVRDTPPAGAWNDASGD
jgi:hypothetical protein